MGREWHRTARLWRSAAALQPSATGLLGTPQELEICPVEGGAALGVAKAQGDQEASGKSLGGLGAVPGLEQAPVRAASYCSEARVGVAPP